MDNGEKCSSLGIGFLLGAAVGLVIGFLYAPHPGAETRAMVREKSGETLHKAEHIIDEAKEKAEKIVEQAKAQAEKIIGKRETKTEERA